MSSRGLRADPRQASAAEFAAVKESKEMERLQAAQPVTRGRGPMITRKERKELEPETSITEAVVKEGLPGIIKGGQQFGEGLFKLPFELFGGVMKGLGIDPKLLIIGALAVGGIVLLVVLK